MSDIRIENQHEIQNNGRDGAFFGSCLCGWRGLNRLTIDESTKDAVDHANNRTPAPARKEME